MEFACTACGTTLQATATRQVTVIVCPKCSQVFEIPHDGSAHTLSLAETVNEPFVPDLQQQTVDHVEATSAYPSGPRSSGQSSPQRLFGDYELLKEIGRGGMGVVYKARHVPLNRIVALKMIKAGDLASDEEVKRFHAEAEAAAQLDHPGIIPIYEVGEHNGQQFFSMGFVEGESLKEKLDEGPLSPGDAALIVLALAEAVQYAHDRGIVHRDLKPANVLMDGPQANDTQKGHADSSSHHSLPALGNPRIMDFGLAKRIEFDSGLTATGQVMGTPSYMPPEQAAGKTNDVGPLADVYSLGAILYCMLTGRPPFQAANVMQTLQQVLEQEPVAPTKLLPRLPRDLETICLKCLAKEPTKRYATADDLAADLWRFLHSEPIIARPVDRVERVIKWAKRRPAIAGLLAMLVVVLTLGVSGVVWQWREAVSARNEAVKRETAERAAREGESQAKSAAQESEQNALQAERLSQQEVARLRSETGVRLMNDGDLFESLLWTLAALATSESLERSLHEPASDATRPATIDEPQRTAIQRFRVGAILAHFPALTAEWQLPLGTIDDEFKRQQFLEFAFSDDGQYLDLLWRKQLVRHHFDNTQYVDLDGDQRARRWQIASGTEVTLALPDEPINNFQVSPDRRWGVVLSLRSIRLWDFENRRYVKEIPISDPNADPIARLSFLTSAPGAKAVPSRGMIVPWTAARLLWGGNLKNHIFFSSDGRRAMVEEKRQAIVWDVVDQKALTPKIAVSERKALLSPTGRWLAFADRVGALKLWDVDEKREIRLPDQRSPSVNRIRFDADERWLLAVSGTSVQLWSLHNLHQSRGTDADPRDEPVSHLYLPHSDAWQRASISEDGRFVATTEDGRRAIITDTRSGRRICPPLPHPSSIWGTLFTPDSRRLAVIGIDGLVRVWDLAGRRLERGVIGHSDGVDIVRFSHDGKWLATGGLDQTVRIWNVGTKEEAGRAIRTDGFPVGLSWNRHDIQIAVTQRSFREFKPSLKDRLQNSARVWNAFTGQPVSPRFQRFAQALGTGDVRFHPQRDQIIIQYKNLLHTFDLQQQRTVLEVHHAPAPFIVPQVLFSPSGRHFVSLGQGYVKLWDCETGVGWRTWLTSYEADVSEMQFNADGTKLAVAARTSLWCFDVNVRGQAVFRKSSSESGDVARICFSPDGKVLLVARIDGVCQTWDIADGRLLHSWQIGGVPLFMRCGTHDAMDWVVTVTRSGVWQMWSWQLGEALSPPMLHGANVLSADLSPDGKTLATAGENGIVRLWTLPGTCDDSTSDLAKMARQLSTRQLDPNDGGLVALERDPSTPAERITVRIDAENARSWARRHIRESSMIQEWASVQRGARRLLIESPNDISLLRLQAMARSRGSDMLDLESWDWVVQSEQSTAEDWESRGLALEKSKRYPEAIEAYNKALARLPTDERLAMHRALLQLATQQGESFDKSYLQMIQRRQAFRPRNPAATAVRLANRAEWQTTLELIETQLSSLLDPQTDRTPNDSNGVKGRLQLARGYIHFRLGDWAKAKADFMGALSDLPEKTEAYRGLAWSCRVLGELQAALKHAKQGLTINAKDANLHLARGMIFVRLRRSAEALGALSQAIQRGEDYGYVRETRASVSLAMGKSYDALVDLSRAIEQSKDTSFIARTMRAQVHAMHGDWPLAEVDFAKAHALRPSDLQTLGDWATVAVCSDNSANFSTAASRAMEFLHRRRLKADPSIIRFAFLTATLRPTSSAPLARFLPLMEHIAAEKPSTSSWHLHGATLFRLGAYEAAISEFDESLEASAKLVSKVQRLVSTVQNESYRAMCLHNLNRQKEAASALKKAEKAHHSLPRIDWRSRGRLASLLSEAKRMLSELSAETAARSVLIEEQWNAEIDRCRKQRDAEPWKKKHIYELAQAMRRHGNALDAQVIYNEAIHSAGQPCVLLTGAGEFISAPQIPLHEMDEFTIEIWMKDFRGQLLRQGRGRPSGAPEHSLWIWCMGGNHFWYGWETADDIIIGGKVSVDGDVKDWTHLAIVFDGASHSCFVNGQLKNSGPAEPIGKPEPKSNLRIGHYDVDDTFGSGYVRALRISNTVRYTASFQPPASFASDEKTAINLDFSRLDGKTDEVPDLSGNGNDGKIHNAWWLQRKLKDGQ